MKIKLSSVILQACFYNYFELIFVFLSAVHLQENRSVLRQLSNQHHHPVAQERGGGTSV